MLLAQFASAAAVLIFVGAVVMATTGDLVEVEKRYDDICTQLDGAACVVTLEIKEEMKGPIYFYYGLEGFHQNHRRYLSSRDDYQMHGSNERTKENLERTCAHMIESCSDPTLATKKECEAAGGGTVWQKDKTRLPCGLVAGSFHNDKFTITTAGVTMVESKLSWDSDSGDRFKNPSCYAVADDGSGTPQVQHAVGSYCEDKVFLAEQYPYLNDDEDAAGAGWNLKVDGVENEHFMVWMRPAALSSFRKLYGKIEDATLPAGSTLSVEVENRFDVTAYKGKKTIIIGTTGWMGGKNRRMGLIFILIGLGYLILFGALLGKRMTSGRKLGDPQLA